MPPTLNRKVRFPRSAPAPCPSFELARLCFDGRYNKQDIERMLIVEGGLSSYLGTTELIEVERRIAARDEKAALVFEAMAYQIAKEIGAMASALEGRVDAILISGGMAHSQKLVAAVRKIRGLDRARASSIPARKNCRPSPKVRCASCGTKRPPRR